MFAAPVSKLIRRNMADLVNSSPEMEFQAEDKQSSSPAVQQSNSRPRRCCDCGSSAFSDEPAAACSRPGGGVAEVEMQAGKPDIGTDRR